jgi:hypothetical protein
VNLRRALNYALCATLVAFGCLSCQIVDQAERDRKEEQLETTQSKDAAREAITGESADRDR